MCGKTDNWLNMLFHALNQPAPTARLQESENFKRVIPVTPLNA